MDWIAPFVALVRKELLAVLKDPANRLILVVPVILQSLLFGYAATYDLADAPYALLDESRSVSSAELVARLDGNGMFRRVATLASPAQIAGPVEHGDALMVLHIPADFERRLLTGRAAPVQLILDARNSTTAGSAAAYANAIVAAYDAERGARPPIDVVTRAWFNPNLETRWNFMPALIASLSMIQVLLLAALSVAREREQGTFDQLLVTPLSPLAIMAGKALPPLLIGLVQSSIVLTVTRWWFDVPMAGSLASLYGGLLLFIVAGVGVGLSISAVALDMQQAMLYTFVLLMPLMLLSGLMTPIRNMPDVLQVATYANPLRYGIDLVRRVYLEGAGVAALATDAIGLVLIAAATMPAAAWLFRHRLA
ncbi:MAG: ABC transporter permease [Proteobacteria bacterium]|nr:ABC transporter permease [Pseudomonadota bacterium]